MTQNDTSSGPGSPGGGPDLEALARRYMDMWQKQVSTVMSDPKLAEALAKSMAFVSEAAKTASAHTARAADEFAAKAGGGGAGGPDTPSGTDADTASPAAPQPEAEDDAPGRPPTAAAAGTDGSPADAAAPGPSGDDVARMAERIDTLERRLAILETAFGGLATAARAAAAERAGAEDGAGDGDGRSGNGDPGA